jgi:hypothetical protein
MYLNENFWTDIALLVTAGAVGGLIGASLAYVKCRIAPPTAPPPAELRVVQRTAKIIRFPNRN